MSLLTIIQHVCERTALPKPADIMGNTDTQIVQLRALLEEECEDLASRGSWEKQTIEADHTTLALEDQGAMTDIADNGFRYIKNGTIFDRTTFLPVAGPMNDREWQYEKARNNNGPRFRYRIRGGKLLTNPVPDAGDEWYFEYVTENWILAADGTTYKKFFTLNTDTILMPETLAIMGLRWRWKKEKGLDYAQDFDTYEFQVKDALGRDGGKNVIRADGQNREIKPGIYIPETSWNL